MFFGNFVNDIVVLQNGLKKMNQYDSLPKCMLESLKAKNVKEFLKKVHRLEPGFLRKCKASVYFYDEEENQQYEVERGEHQINGRDIELKNMEEKLDAICEREDIPDDRL